MKKILISTLLTKQSITIFLLFLLFFPVKTQLQNITFFIFDYLFTHGITSEIYTYNYTGSLLGCEQLAQIRKLQVNFNLFQKFGIFYIKHLPSIIAFIILLRRWKLKKIFLKTDWVLTLVSCFSILNALEFSYILIPNLDRLPLRRIVLFSSISLPFLLIGAFIFFKIFSFKERIQVIFIGVPTIILGAFIWFYLIGPKILPVIV